MTREERAKAAILRLTEANGDGIQSFTFDDLLREFIAFADAEAAAMRERAAGVAQGEADDIRRVHQAHDTWQGGRIAMAEYIASHIRSLPATGEVGRD